MKIEPAVTPQAAVAPKKQESELREAAQGFESLLINEMLKSMRKAAGGADKPFGESVFTSMLDEKLAQNIAESGAFGLAQSIVTQMQSTPAQENPQSVDAPTERPKTPKASPHES